MKTPLILRLLGGFGLESEAGQSVAVEPARLRHLVAYLALHPERAHARADLASRLWPQSRETQARTNLRKLLHSLRQSAPQLQVMFAESDAGLMWAPDSVEVDAIDLLRLAANSKADVADLETAAQTARLELFPECYEDWIVPLQEDCREASRTVLRRLIDHHESADSFDAVIDHARSLLALDPLDELVATRLMHAYARSGAHARAAAVYESTVRYLERDLGIGPSPTFAQSYRELVQKLDSRALLVHETPTLVARDDSLAALKETMNLVKHSGSRITLLQGEPGIGKTRLIESAVDTAHQEGFVVHRGVCLESAQHCPFAPLIETLKAMGRQRLAALDEPWRSELSRLVPEILPSLSQPGHRAPEPWQLERFLEAITRCLLPDNSPVLIVFDDLQWVDSETLRWMSHLLRTHASSPVLMVVAMRTGWEMSQEFLQILTELGRASRIDTLQLKRFPLMNTTRLAEVVLGESISKEFATQLHEQSEGNPLFIVELARAAKTLDLAGTPKADSTPAPIQSVVRSKLDLLSDVARKLACETSVFRGEILPSHVHALCGDEGSLTDVVEELCLKDLWKLADSTVHESYRFGHNMIRELIFQTLSSPKRAELHRRAADILSSTKHEFPEVGFHLENVPDLSAAIAAYTQASDVAMAMNSPAESVRVLRHAGQLAGALEGTVPDEGAAMLAAIHERLGRALIQVGRRTDGRTELEDALARHGQNEPRRRAEIHLALAETWTWEYDLERASAALDRASELLIDESDVTARNTWLDVQLARAELLYYTNQGSALPEQLALIEGPIRESGNRHHRLTFLRCVAMEDFRRTRYWKPTKALESAVESFESLTPDEDRDLYILAQFGVGFAQLWSGEIEGALLDLEEAANAAAHTANAPAELRAVTYLGVATRFAGDIDKTREAGTRAAELAPLAKDPVYTSTAAANLAWCAWRDGDRKAAEEMARHAAEGWADKPYPFKGLAFWILIAISDGNDEVAVREFADRLASPDQFWRPEFESILDEVRQQGCLTEDQRTVLRSLNLL